MCNGETTIANTVGRKSGIVASLDAILSSGLLSKHDALRLRGRLQIAAGQIFGRVAKRVDRCHILCLYAYGASSSPTKVSAAVLASLAIYRKLLCVDVPRELQAQNSNMYIIFADASFEPDHPSWQAGIGAVLCLSDEAFISFFSEHVGSECRTVLNKTGRKTMILELEFFTVWCCLKLWSKLLCDAQVTIYTDNDGVRDCLISCQTDSLNGRPILDACLRAEFNLRSNFWYAPVPRDSNVADWPSRNELEDDLNLFSCSMQWLLTMKWGRLTSIDIPSLKKMRVLLRAVKLESLSKHYEV